MFSSFCYVCSNTLSQYINGSSRKSSPQSMKYSIIQCDFYLYIYMYVQANRPKYVQSCRVGKVMCLGVTAGAYILTLFAVSYSPLVHFDLF